MKEQKKNRQKGSWNMTGVYVAIGICLVAVAAASWTTFRSISSTLSSTIPDTSESQLAEQTETTVSGVTESDETEALADTEETEEAADVQPETTAANTTPTSFCLPLENTAVTKSFSGSELVYSQTLKDWRTHNGTDFSAESGDTVFAAADGTVIEEYDDGLFGVVVTVESGDITVSYCGLQEDTAVAVGDFVTAGQEIGQVGTIPAEQSEGDHLHLEVRQNGTFLDCASFLPG
jgi:murein DD-endopeptidase MepM/ murein hydrolase activator NlpD